MTRNELPTRRPLRPTSTIRSTIGARFRKVLRVINELEDLLDRRVDRHSGVDLGRDSASLTDLPKRIGRADSS